MALIYGGIPKSSSSSFYRQIYTIFNVINWEGAIHHEIVWKDFHGGIILSPALPYSADKLYSIDNNILVLLSGVIYNNNEIALELSSKDKKYTDSELILSAYQKWGDNFVTKLNGDFAIFIYNEPKKLKLFFRDQVGIRPLALGKKGDSLFFSSDMMGLCKALYQDEDIDREYLIKQIIGSAFGKYHILPNENVEKVKPGHFVRIEDNHKKEIKYWFPHKVRIDNKLDLETAKKELLQIVQDAVRIRSDKRFFASTHLSGGLDSGIVASLAKKEFQKQEKFYGFTWSPSYLKLDKVDSDERERIDDICSSTGIIPIPNNFDLNDYLKYEKDWRIASYLFEESKTRANIARLGVNLVFSGWGGDEFISINSRGIDSDLIFKMQWRSFLKKNRSYNPIRLAKIIALKVVIPAFYRQIFIGNSDTFDFSKYFLLTKREKKELRNDSISWLSRKQVHLKLLNENFLAERTEDWSINGIRNGIEYRYPLLDKRIIEYMFKVPSKILFKDGYVRIILREISDGLLPDSVRWHNSKYDEAKYMEDKNLLDVYCKTIINHSKELRSNPLLQFINFDLLFNEMRNEIDNRKDKYVCTHCRTVLEINRIHEFTKKYFE